MPQKSTRSRASSANNNDANGENNGATTVATADAEAPETENEVSETRDPWEDGFLNLADLKEMSISKLTSIAKGMDVPGATGMRSAVARSMASATVCRRVQA